MLHIPQKFKRNGIEYFFGFGANRENLMIELIIGRKVNSLGKARLKDYALYVQSLENIPNSGNNPRKILRESWGDDFKSYCIVKQRGSVVEGSLFEMTVRERKMIDIWELVYEDWQKSIVVSVCLEDSSLVQARTQGLQPGQDPGVRAPANYDSWLMPVSDFIQVTKEDSKR